MKTAAAYIRVSTDDQLEFSPDSQKKAVLAYAKQHEMILPEEFIFTDEGISGRSAKRPAFQKMIGMAKLKPKLFDVILVWKFSRFARNREDSIVYKSMLRKQCDIDVISVSEPIGEDKTSVLIEALLEAMDEYYSINLSEEVVRGMTEKAHRGGILGGQPFGYYAEKGKIKIDEASAPIVRKIFEDFVSGVPIRKIANDLNASGIKTKYGNLWDNRGIEYLLRNIAYLGKSHWTPEAVKSKHAEKLSDMTIIADSHEAIISEELFQQAQEKITFLKTAYPYKAHPHHGKPFTLKGMCRCSDCSATLVRAGEKGVQCHQYTTGKCHTSHFITFEKLNQLVVNQLELDYEQVSIPDLKSMVNRQEEQDSNAPAYKLQLRKLNQQMKRVKDAYISGIDTLEEYRENKAKLQKQIEETQQKMQSDTPPVPLEELLVTLKSSIKTGIEIFKSNMDEELKNELLRSFIHDIVFDREKNAVVIHYMI